MKTFTIIAYDISNNRKRQKVAKFLEQYGSRANKSVFECFITPKQTTEIKLKIEKLINKQTDTILFYTLCKNCIKNITTLGNDFMEYDTIKTI